MFSSNKYIEISGGKASLNGLREEIRTRIEKERERRELIEVEE